MHAHLLRIPDGPRDTLLVLSLSISRRLEGPLVTQPTETGAELALDNSGCTCDSLAARSSHFVHAGRLHPYPAGPGDRRDFDPGDPGTQSRLAPVCFRMAGPGSFSTQACFSIHADSGWPRVMDLATSRRTPDDYLEQLMTRFVLNGSVNGRRR